MKLNPDFELILHEERYDQEDDYTSKMVTLENEFSDGLDFTNKRKRISSSHFPMSLRLGVDDELQHDVLKRSRNDKLTFGKSIYD